MAATTLEEILLRLLVPDNAVIQQATKDLQSVFKDPSVVSPLCQVLVASQNPQVRQYAAVLLRKKVVQVWKQLPTDTQLVIKSSLLQHLSQENVHLVSHSIAHLVAVIVKRDFSVEIQWNELNQFVQQHWSSSEPAHKQLAMLMLNKLMDIAAYHYHGNGQFPSLLQIFSAALVNYSDIMVPFYSLKSLTAMVAYMGTDELPMFRPLIPKIMLVVKSLIQLDEDKACESMELFDELVECDVAIVAPHITSLIQFCLEVAINSSLGNNIRVKVLSFVSWLVTLKKKYLLKQGLLPNIFEAMLTIMATPTEDEDDTEDSTESQSPTTLAAQVLDVLSNNLPPDKVFTPLMQMLNPWIQSPNEFQRCAALIAIAVITEGCSEFIKNDYLKALLDVIYKAVGDESRVVRNAALFAIGQFAEYLQPEISKFSEDLMPVLFQFLDLAISAEHTKHTSSMTKIFYALESFIENLGVDLLPYLSTLMEKLFLTLSFTKDIHIMELVISAFGAAANACEDKLQPYFQRVIDILMHYISTEHTQENAILQAQAVDTLGTLARTIGKDNFKPLAQDCVALGKSLMESGNPDMRRSVYGMFASVSCILKEEFGPYLAPIVEKMMESLTSDEGIKVHYNSFEVSFLDFENGEDGGGEGAMDSIEDDEGIEGYSVENSYLEEKQDTCNSLGEIAENVESQFLPYIDDCFKEVSVLTEHSLEDIRKAAIWTQGRFCKVWYKSVVTNGLDGKEDLEVLINSTLLSFAASVRTDSDRKVVLATLETLEDLLKCLKRFAPFAMQERALSSLIVSVSDVFSYKAQCQEEGEEEEPLPGDEMAEYDTMLVECASSILGPLAEAVGGELFLPQVQPLLPILLAKLTGPTASVADQSLIIGTLAEIADGVGTHARFLPSLYQLFVEYSANGKDEEVCSNAVYGLGVLAANGGPDMCSNYQSILQQLFSVAHSRKEAKTGRILDNVCGAVCRMISANQEAVPLNQVLPMLIQSLPLREDMDENVTIYNCLLKLFREKNPVMMSHLTPMLRVIAQELSPSSQLSKDLQQQLASLVFSLNSECPAEMQTASQELTPNELSTLTRAANI